MAVNATAIWRVRPSGNNANGGGYDPAISGAGTDYSKQNAAQASGVNGTASATTTFSDSTANAFTSAMVGNAIWIASGAGFTVSAYFVTAFTSASTVTIDRSPGTGTVANWKLGGAWADPTTNATTSGPVVAGNIIFVLGSGIPNPSSYTYDYTIPDRALQSGGTAGYITWANDPATPSYKAPPDTTGGMPVIKLSTGGFNNNSSNYAKLSGLYFVAFGGGNNVLFNSNNSALFGCVLDSNANSIGFVFAGQAMVVGCEVFTSAVGGSGSGINVGGASQIMGCNIHDIGGIGITVSNNAAVFGCIVAKCGGNGIRITSGGNSSVINCTIDGNGGHGFDIADNVDLNTSVILNNIISNHTTAGKFGIIAETGSVPTNDLIKMLIDYNTFYNNTSNYSAISAGPHDTALGVTPYVNSATENYTLA